MNIIYLGDCLEVLRDYIPKLQVLTLKDYSQNKMQNLPKVNITFKAARLQGKKM